MLIAASADQTNVFGVIDYANVLFSSHIILHNFIRRFPSLRPHFNWFIWNTGSNHRYALRHWKFCKLDFFKHETKNLLMNGKVRILMHTMWCTRSSFKKWLLEWQRGFLTEWLHAEEKKMAVSIIPTSSNYS